MTELTTHTMDGLVLPPGAGRTLVTSAQVVTMKVTGERTQVGSLFEVVVPPGFDVGAHAHANSEEVFYVLEGELEILAFEPRERTPDNWERWESRSGRRPVRATPGSVAHVPPGCPHAFANRTDRNARMLVQAAPPPNHERYFEELLEILNADGPPDEAAVSDLRRRYGIDQLTPLRTRLSGQP
ncbi:cupin domain-containing protein [Streptomyces mauvecolor]|uniref:Cupin domain-containing protein n=1 Tax=Streptomyces mauvecolor TaxID=58345 RepID=A0ABV9UVG9_9ACTN